MQESYEQRLIRRLIALPTETEWVEFIADKNYSMVSRVVGLAIRQGLVKKYDPMSKSKKAAKYLPFWA